MPIVLVGTLDTKGRELGFVREILRLARLETIVIDAGALGAPAFEPEIDRERVFFRAGTSPEEVRALGDRGSAVAAAARGVASIVADLHAQGKVQGIFALGGSAGTTIGTQAMRALPFGVPKVMVSTLASGQTRPFVGGLDIMMVHSVADIAGLNRVTRKVLSNAARALAGMVSDVELVIEDAMDRPLVAASMFGVTTPCVDRARQALESWGAEVIVFHATGVGGQAMESLIAAGQLAGVLDLTTTELADELVGGILSAGPDRLEAAGRRGLPQVVSVGALDMVNFGPPATIPERFQGRTFHAHNPNVTLMRTTPVENAALGSRMAEVLGGALGPVSVMIPRGGISALDAPGQPFFDPEADAALFSALSKGLEGHPRVRLVERPEHINDPAFAIEAARELLGMLRHFDPNISDVNRLATSWATEADLPELLGFLEATGLPVEGVAANLDGFVVARGADGRLVGSAGLEPHGDLALLRSVAVAPEARGLGLGSRLVATLLNRAAADGVAEVVLFSKAAGGFFSHRFGFEGADRAEYEPRLAGSPEWGLEHCATASLWRLALNPLEAKRR